MRVELIIGVGIEPDHESGSDLVLTVKRGVLGPVNTNPMRPLAPEKVPIKARGEKFGDSI